MSVDLHTPSIDQLAAGTWNLDRDHTHVGFVARHMMVSKVRGSFGEFDAEIQVADDPMASSLTATVQLSSIDTGSADRDNHLRTNDFFDIEQYPTMTLRSTGFERSGDNLVMHSDLTIRGVTKPVDWTLEFDGVGTDPWGGTRAGFTARTTVNRKDWGIEWNAPLEAGGVLVGDKVQLEIDAQVVKA